jgi:hypothetical protein
MKKELQTQLVEKYPKIFQEVGKSPQESCMAFGIECGDGWYWLIDNLCKSLQFDIDNRGDIYPQVVASQVKEKFGGLRFYVNSANPEQYAVIDLAESMSYAMCEKCGSTEDVKQVGQWIQTLCLKCRESKTPDS